MAETSKKLTWDNTADHLYETGVSNGVLYVMGADGKYGKGVAWNGLTAVTESPSGAEPTALYADDKKYLNLMSVEEFGATIEAYTYPDEFAKCDGSAEIAEGVVGVSIGQQSRSKFAFCYRSKVGNAENDKLGYKLHIIYGCLAAPSEKAYATVNDSPEAITFSWEVSTTPVKVSDGVYTSCVTIDSTKCTNIAALEAILYGTETEDAKLPMPEEIVAALKAE